MSSASTRDPLKPDAIELVRENALETEKEKTAAKALREYWNSEETGKSFYKIAEKTTVSDSTIGNIYYEFFGYEGGSQTFQELKWEQEHVLEEFWERKLSDESFSAGDFLNTSEDVDEVVDEPLTAEQIPDNLPVEEFEGKSLDDLIGWPPTPERVMKLMQEVWRLADLIIGKREWQNGYRQGVKDEREGK